MRETSKGCGVMDEWRRWRHVATRWLVAGLALVLVIWPAAAGAQPEVEARARQDAAIRRIVETFAKSAVDEGLAVGVSVGITYGGQHHFFGYGLADALSRIPATPATIYEIGSVTKIFTTALLGENVVEGINQLSQPLSDFETQIGPLSPTTRRVKLKELGDFTAGFPSLPPLCPTPTTVYPPGCLPNERPGIDEYTAGDLADYFRWFEAPIPLPATYLYSDISTGMIGLLLGASPDTHIDNGALDGWLSLVRVRIVNPLGLVDTFLRFDETTPEQRARMAAGYAQALATATVSSHAVQSISVTGPRDSPGQGYTSVPTVTIQGGGGSGAQASAKIKEGKVTDISVDATGQDYEAPGKVVFTCGNPPCVIPATEADGAAIVADGQVVGIRIAVPGAGYADSDVWTVQLEGGTKGPWGWPATLGDAVIANGSVVYVKVLDGGQGYVDPITVLVDPPAPPNVTIKDDPIPIWAPAGALKSTVGDLVELLDVALGHLDPNGQNYPDRLRLWNGFQVAMQPYACQTALDGACIAQSGLAWDLTPADNGIPLIISKNGGLSGFSSEVRLAPARDLGVVVLVNSRQAFDNAKKPDATAALISDNILYAILETSD